MTTQSIGNQFARHVKSAGHRAPLTLPNVDAKTLMTTSAGFAPETRTDAAPVDSATRVPTLLDRVLATPTDSSPYPYMEETTFTNNAAERAEGDTYGEAALGFTRRFADVASIDVWMPVTDEQLQDVDALGAHLDLRLGFMCRQRLEGQMVSGSGTGPNLRGILNVSGVQTQAKSTDTAAVAIRKAITKVRTPGLADPDLIVVHPTDAEGIDLDAQAVDPLAAYADTSALWTLPKQETTSIAQGSALVGDFGTHTALKIRKGITLELTNAHASFFSTGKLAVRARIRVAFPVFRPSAFCVVTGL